MKSKGSIKGSKFNNTVQFQNNAWRDDFGGGCNAEYINADWCAANANEKFPQKEGQDLSACDAGCLPCAEACSHSGNTTSSQELFEKQAKLMDLSKKMGALAVDSIEKIKSDLNIVNNLVTNMFTEEGIDALLVTPLPKKAKKVIKELPSKVATVVATFQGEVVPEVEQVSETNECNYSSFKGYENGGCQSYGVGGNNYGYCNDSDSLNNMKCKSYYACDMKLKECHNGQQPNPMPKVQYTNNLPFIVPQEGKPDTYCTQDKFRSDRNEYLTHNQHGHEYSGTPNTNGCESYRYGNGNSTHCDDGFYDSDHGFSDTNCKAKDACEMPLCNDTYTSVDRLNAVGKGAKSEP